MIESIKETLQRSLITESPGINTSYIEVNQVSEWAKSIGCHMTKRREDCVKDDNDKRKIFQSKQVQDVS
jgi:hypothetical protein